MLLYGQMENLSLDTFERSRISIMFEYVINSINRNGYSYDAVYRDNIFIDIQYNKQRFNKTQIQIKILAFDDRLNYLIISHFNPFSPYFGKPSFHPIDGNKCFRYRKLKAEIIYKKMEIPLGKFKVNF